MIFLNKYTFFFILLLIITPSVKAQNNQIDSLSKLSFEVLEKHFNKVTIDSINDVIYGNAMLLKAKRQSNSITIADAYFYLSDASSSSKALKYCDSIIDLTKKIKLNKTYPSLGYLQRGNINYNLGKYKKALDDYLLCYEVSIVNRSQLYQMVAKQNIGLLKNKIGDRKEALKIFRSYINYIENNDFKNKDFYLTNGYYLLADSYMYNKKLDSASWFINKGLKKAISIKDSLMHAHYVYLSGVNYFFDRKYTTSIDSLLRSKHIYYEETLNSTINLYLGKSYYKLNKKNKALKYFKEVDSFLQRTKNITSEIIEIYKPLIESEKNKNNLKQQLYYINSLLKFDSILNKNNKYLSKNIAKQIEIPALLSRRDNIIEELNLNSKISKKYIFLLMILSILLVTSMIYLIQKNITNKKKLKALLETKNYDRVKTASETTTITATTGLSEEIVKDVLLKLQIFENKDKYLKYYTLSSLAKELKTNSSYLSKIINSSKEGNFANYLNKLRIEYAINKLKTDRSFRLYTVQAIAEDVGFNKAQSFSTAFKKQTGISVIYFIKQLIDAKTYDYK
jgi:AraC-like DNA-binding protein